METKYGWFSNKQARAGGTALYGTPYGKDIEVTMVTHTRTQSSNWDDMVYLGEVTVCKRGLSGGELDELLNYLMDGNDPEIENADLDPEKLARLQKFVDKRLVEAARDAAVERIEQQCIARQSRTDAQVCVKSLN